MSARTDPLTALYSTLDDVERDFAAVLPERSEGLKDEEILIWAMVTHAVRVFRAIRLLLRDRLASEASVLNRVLLEVATQLVHFMRNRSRLEELRLRLIHDAVGELERLADFEVELDLPLGQEAKADVTQRRSDLIAAFGRINVKPGGLPSVRQMLKEAGKESRYWYYKRASADAHGDIPTLGTKMQERSKGEYVAALTDNPKTVLVIGMAAADHFMSAMIAAADILDLAVSEDLKRRRDEFDNRQMTLLREAGFQETPVADGGMDASSE